MPKGRHLKPDFFTDKHIVSMSPLARLLYQGLWCYSHDCGHLDDEPVELKMRILPADSCDVEDLLSELVESGRIERANGVIYLPKLSEHARVDKRYETACEACKPLRVPVGKTPQSRSDHAVTTKGSQRDHDADGDGDGDGDGDVKVTGRKRPATRLAEDWKPTEKHWERRHDGIDVEREAQKFRLHAEANDRRAVNWNAAFSQWLLNARPSETSTARATGWGSPQPLPPCPAEVADDSRAYAAWIRDWNAGKSVPTADGGTARKAS